MGQAITKLCSAHSGEEEGRRPPPVKKDKNIDSSGKVEDKQSMGNGHSTQDKGKGKAPPPSLLPPIPSHMPIDKSLPPSPSPLPSPNSPFVHRSRNALTHLGAPLRFASLNAPELLEGHPWEAKDTMRTLSGFGRGVTRTYTLKVLSTNVGREDAHIIGWDPKRAEWVWNEDMLRRLDGVLELAERYEVKLIIPIINQDWGQESMNYVGNYTDLVRLHYGFTSNAEARSKVNFWTDGRMLTAFKQLINTLLTRVNTLTSLPYSSHSCILAWETGNELQQVPHELPAPAPWTLAVAAELKRLAPNTLVMDGSFARNEDVRKCYRIECLGGRDVDLFSYHYYGAGSTEGGRVRKDAEYVGKFGKAFIVGEYGFFDSHVEVEQFLAEVAKSSAVGSLIWSLRPHSVMGGFKTHAEDGHHFSYHAGPQHHLSPPERRLPPQFDNRETAIMRAIRTSSFSIVNEEEPYYPTPPPPEVWVESRRRPVAPTFRTSIMIGSRRDSRAGSVISRASTPTETVDEGSPRSATIPQLSPNMTSYFPSSAAPNGTGSRIGSPSHSALPSAHTSLANLAAYEQGLVNGSSGGMDDPLETTVQVLRWRGSAWAQHYEVWRCGRGPEMCADKCVREWHGEGEKDKLGWELPPGAEGGGAKWKVRAIGVDGHQSAWSPEIVVPVLSPRN